MIHVVLGSFVGYQHDLGMIEVIPTVVKVFLFILWFSVVCSVPQITPFECIPLPGLHHPTCPLDGKTSFVRLIYRKNELWEGIVGGGPLKVNGFLFSGVRGHVGCKVS